MNNHIGLGIFGTFGEPYGFQQVFYYGSHFRGSLDIDDAAIEFYPGSDLFSVRREIVDGVHSICINIYTYARELNTARMGTFVGSCMVLQDVFTEADYIYKVLCSMHNDLLTNEDNISKSTIKVAQGSDIIIREPADFVAVQANAIPLNKTPFFSTYVDEEKKFLVVPKPATSDSKDAQVMDFIDEALKNYTDTGTLYFSLDPGVEETVKGAGIIPILSWSDFKARAQSMPPAIVRTKKGIQKTTEPGVATPIPAQPTPTEVPAAASSAPSPTNNDTDNDTDDLDDEYNDDSTLTEAGDGIDRSKPFDLWEEDEANWTPEEAKERIREYNRLFKYTNTLLEHIKDPEDKPKRPSKKTRTLIAALLLLLILGSVAVYYVLNGDEAIEDDIEAVVEDATDPEMVQQNDINENSDSVASAALAIADSIAADSMVRAAEEEQAGKDLIAKYRPEPMEVPAVTNEDQARLISRLSAQSFPKATPQNMNTILGKESAKTLQKQISSKVVEDPMNMDTVRGGMRQVDIDTTNRKASTGGVESAGSAEPSGIMPEILTPPVPRSNVPVGIKHTVAAIGKVAPQKKSTLSTTITEKRPTIAPAQTYTYTATPTPAKPIAAPKKIAPKTITQPTVAIATPITTVATTPPTAKAAAETTKPAATKAIAAAAPMVKPTAARTATATVAPIVKTITEKPAPQTTVAISRITKPNTVAAVNIAPSTATPTTTASTTTRPATATPILRPTSTQTIAANKPSTAISALRIGTKPATIANRTVTIRTNNLYPRPNSQITQKDIELLRETGIKNKTLTELTAIIFEHVPEIESVYRGQELPYSAALLNSNRKAFLRSGSDYVCTADYLILHIPSYTKPRLPVAFPK